MIIVSLVNFFHYLFDHYYLIFNIHRWALPNQNMNYAIALSLWVLRAHRGTEQYVR
jgi:hypothetical protein